jgi:hypothetical protein
LFLRAERREESPLGRAAGRGPLTARRAQRPLPSRGGESGAELRAKG